MSEKWNTVEYEHCSRSAVLIEYSVINMFIHKMRWKKIGPYLVIMNPNWTYL